MRPLHPAVASLRDDVVESLSKAGFTVTSEVDVSTHDRDRVRVEVVDGRGALRAVRVTRLVRGPGRSQASTRILVPKWRAIGGPSARLARYASVSTLAAGLRSTASSATCPNYLPNDLVARAVTSLRSMRATTGGDLSELLRDSDLRIDDRDVYSAFRTVSDLAEASRGTYEVAVPVLEEVTSGVPIEWVVRRYSERRAS